MYNECMIDNAKMREPFSFSDHNIITFDLLYDSQMTTWKEYYFDYRKGNYKETDKSLQIWIGMHYSLKVMLTKSELF